MRPANGRRPPTTRRERLSRHNGGGVNFKELLSQLEERLGSHQFPVNPAATNIKNIFEGSPLHHDTMTGLARAIYVSNACRRLTDPVTLDKTLQALAPIRQEDR